MTNYYIEKNNKIVLIDSNFDRLLNTKKFMPEIFDCPIKETDQDFIQENGEFILGGHSEKYISQKVRLQRNEYLEQTDKYMISDYPITADKRHDYVAYRAYLRDLPETLTSKEKRVMDFDEWKTQQTIDKENKDNS